MDPHEIGTSLYESFARACDKRSARLGTLFERLSAAEIGAKEALDLIGRELHDHLGDAELLALRRVSTTTVELDDLVDTWRALLATEPVADADRRRAEEAVRSARLRSWLERLVGISKRYALSRSDTGQVRDLQALRLEIGRGLERIPSGLSKLDTDPGTELVQKRVLLLDDSEIACELLSVTLEKMGHVVTAASSAEQFWVLLEESAPQVVLIDINLPDERGDVICRQLRQREGFAEIPVVILSSLPDAELAPLTKSVGANAYLSKQHGLDTLCNYVEQLVADGVL